MALGILTDEKRKKQSRFIAAFKHHVSFLTTTVFEGDQHLKLYLAEKSVCSLK